ncbi:DUF2590 family protein [Pseudoalteromonas sp. S16_S37]|uniref:DUF2590 family protein n=1 Tax=Pseudoalteromonas sp. S16_S37 TaxID=2720228 RepID=UPI0016817FF7|nr:DUF2590 family protein [Pseudoalteromonas sp. S16_S37]MBD1582801.1 DUF2590 family protein [Pseudoalteromonas sp. S16_S37]
MIHIDLNIIDGDLSLDSLLQPIQLSERDVIAQDIKHRLIESGKLPLLIGLRQPQHIKRVLTELELIIEEDERLVPGTIQLTPNNDGFIAVTAQTRDYQQEGIV